MRDQWRIESVEKILFETPANELANPQRQVVRQFRRSFVDDCVHDGNVTGLLKSKFARSAFREGPGRG